MDNLFRQTRLRFSGAEQEKKEEPGSSKDRRIAPQKTQSFKDKKKEPNWLRKQVTWQMSQDNDSNNEDERAMAVAAAAYAITENVKEELGNSTVLIKSKKEDPAISIPRHESLSKKFSEEITQSSENPDKLSAKNPEKQLLHAPSFKKTQSSLEKELSGDPKKSSDSFKSGTGILNQNLPTSAITPSGSFTHGNSTSKPDVPAMAKPEFQPTETHRQSSSRVGAGKLQADIWEESELAKITDRYNARKSTIITWEGKKKTKAKHQLDKSERALERTRTQAMVKYRSDIKDIDQIVSGAKAKVEEKKKNDELKAKDKANTFRKTGKVPSTSSCSCF